jgi:hypothetical protein
LLEPIHGPGALGAAVHVFVPAYRGIKRGPREGPFFVGAVLSTTGTLRLDGPYLLYILIS